MHLMLPEAPASDSNSSGPRQASPLPSTTAPPTVTQAQSAAPSNPAPSNPASPTFSSNTSQSIRLPSHENFLNLAAEVRAIRDRVAQLCPAESTPTAPQLPSHPGDVYIVYGHEFQGILIRPDSILHTNPGATISVPEDSSNRFNTPNAAVNDVNITPNARPLQPNAANQRQIDPLRAGGAIIFRNLFQCIRLFFFVYLFSDPGTWTRYLLVIGSLLVIVLGETELYQAVHSLLIAPFHRYLERLTHVGGPDQQPANNQPHGAIPHFRRFQLESFALGRALILLLTSLIPGVGERQVEARNAAEAERQRIEERQREAEQERQREAEQEHQREAEQEHQREAEQEREENSAPDQQASNEIPEQGQAASA
ncbi:hypothetical protein N7468_007535 [Penicillium chermesinum]|uniref:Uncharacterized protein n=1 Tax=Penicillium chermesinum TaxID=63820 RepID=A0A9W9TM96_9EURO|nr:uncharacterized protein N7468_007535 [Penicillium chermesinum]KAJ5226310.1 hypothetical protein N7468_007535 [Penicillium chermesinum]